MDKCALFWNILAVQSQKGLGRDASDPLERAAQMALIGKAELLCNLRERCSSQKLLFGLLDPQAENVLMRRCACGLFKLARKVIGTQANQPRERRQRKLLGEMIMNIVSDLPHVDG